ncbi:OBAP family protein [Brachybacterium sp. ACRRE]|uniref:OBAP family protein n=1 Tax=Brachybacterium sp. ACRRE TaxID=2918184 RepID=UPI001EF366B6|nr:OBAP family protein [Brachybacterium sp. ACRRE]MCG7309437.1 OBAP family protein [Brachybacterium sp. ACRRE]
MKSLATGLVLGIGVAAATVTGRKTMSNLRTSRSHPWRHRLLDLGSAFVQRKRPPDAMSTYLDGLHMYADDTGRQVHAAHFCIHLEHDLHQCVIFDRNSPDARLIGIEYIISEERFRALPEEEKKLWHSHHYEIKSGILTAPGVPKIAEHAYFEDLVKTYGKTFHTWQYDLHDFPYGAPQLMMGFTADGQVLESLVQERDREVGVSTKRNREHRENIPVPAVAEGANSWESGRVMQTTLQETSVQR